MGGVVRVAVHFFAQAVDLLDGEGRDRVVDVLRADGALVLVLGQVLLPVTGTVWM
jgi:hypothetical protein